MAPLVMVVDLVVPGWFRHVREETRIQPVAAMHALVKVVLANELVASASSAAQVTVPVATVLEQQQASRHRTRNRNRNRVI